MIPRLIDPPRRTLRRSETSGVDFQQSEGSCGIPEPTVNPSARRSVYAGSSGLDR
jgi:hypothetical protein